MNNRLMYQNFRKKYNSPLYLSRFSLSQFHEIEEIMNNLEEAAQYFKTGCHSSTYYYLQQIYPQNELRMQNCHQLPAVDYYFVSQTDIIGSGNDLNFNKESENEELTNFQNVNTQMLKNIDSISMLISDSQNYAYPEDQEKLHREDIRKKNYQIVTKMSGKSKSYGQRAGKYARQRSEESEQDQAEVYKLGNTLASEESCNFIENSFEEASKEALYKKICLIENLIMEKKMKCSNLSEIEEALEEIERVLSQQ